MSPLEIFLRPAMTLVNRKIEATTPARELCRQLDGKTLAVRVRNTALVTYFLVADETLSVSADADIEPDAVITGSFLSLARLSGESGEQTIRQGSLELTGDAGTAQAFQKLFEFAKPDIEEEISGIVGDVAAHRLGELSRGLGNWSRGARSTMRENIREYLQEESRDVPGRYEVERFSREVDALRDDVERAGARLDRLIDNRR